MNGFLHLIKCSAIKKTHLSFGSSSMFVSPTTSKKGFISTNVIKLSKQKQERVIFDLYVKFKVKKSLNNVI